MVHSSRTHQTSECKTYCQFGLLLEIQLEIQLSITTLNPLLDSMGKKMHQQLQLTKFSSSPTAVNKRLTCYWFTPSDSVTLESQKSQFFPLPVLQCITNSSSSRLQTRREIRSDIFAWPFLRVCCQVLL